MMVVPEAANDVAEFAAELTTSRFHGNSGRRQFVTQGAFSFTHTNTVNGHKLVGTRAIPKLFPRFHLLSVRVRKMSRGF